MLIRADSKDTGSAHPHHDALGFGSQLPDGEVSDPPLRDLAVADKVDPFVIVFDLGDHDLLDLLADVEA
jgi:hypothetical protein